VAKRGGLRGVCVDSSGNDSTGAHVAEVVSGSPAEDAGIEVGDVITKVDDTDVADGQELVAAIREHSSGDEVTITYERDGQSHTATVTLGGTSSDSGTRSSSSATN
jgi:putative serine protease PepD